MHLAQVQAMRVCEKMKKKLTGREREAESCAAANIYPGGAYIHYSIVKSLYRNFFSFLSAFLRLSPWIETLIWTISESCRPMLTQMD